MKSMHLIPVTLLVLTTTGCTNRSSDDVVSATYVHRYGVELSPEDWSSRGQDGCVVATRKDGVMECRNYDKGVLHGETTYTFAHRDAIDKREYYDQGQLVRTVENYSNGTPYKQTTYDSPSQQSVTTWFDNGSPHANEKYENGALREGEYFTITNQKEAVVDNSNGQRVLRDRYGQLLSQDQIEEGNMVSRTTFHPNGSPASVTPYVNGIPHGEKVTYHPGGEPNTIESWNNGVQHGNTTVYQNGEKFADVPYKNGEKNGVEQRYRNGTEPVERVTWEKDVQHGPTTSYGSTNWYFQGQKVTKVAYDAMSNQ